MFQYLLFFHFQLNVCADSACLSLDRVPAPMAWRDHSSERQSPEWGKLSWRRRHGWEDGSPAGPQMHPLEGPAQASFMSQEAGNAGPGGEWWPQMAGHQQGSEENVKPFCSESVAWLRWVWPQASCKLLMKNHYFCTCFPHLLERHVLVRGCLCESQTTSFAC